MKQIRLKKIAGAAIIGLSLLYSPPVMAAYTGVVSINAQGAHVKQIQERLHTLGYYNHRVTGHFGPITQNAVILYQRDNKLKSDGIIGPATYNALFSGEPAAASRGDESGSVYRIGSTGNRVLEIQNRLVELGYLKARPTGYYGTLTQQAVKQFQRSQGLLSDGIVGRTTYSRLMDGNAAINSRSSQSAANGLLPWFGGVDGIFPRNSNARVTDIDTGISFNIRRTAGTNHADVETLTQQDTDKMLQIYGGKWSWARRAVIVEVNGIRIAGSMAGMPHDFQFIRGNGMNGHFDIHFLNSRTHGTNRVNQEHQNMVRKAAAFLENQ